MSWERLSEQVAAEFEAAQALSHHVAEPDQQGVAKGGWRGRPTGIQEGQLQSQAAAGLMDLKAPCSCPGCSALILVIRPRDKHPLDGRRYCSPYCRRKHWRLLNPERDRAQNRASYNRTKRRPVPS